MRAHCALLVALLCAATASAQDWRRPLEGYVDWPSVRAGTTLALHVSSRTPSFDVQVVREGESAVRWEARGLPGGVQSVPAGAPATDCAWPVACEIPVGADWPSGVWWARLSAPADPQASCEIPFVVRSASPSARILSITPECTAQAYNAWGGASLYSSAYGPPQPVVNLHRPHEPAATLRAQTSPELDPWLRARGLAVEWAADVDLQREPDLLDRFDLLLVAGHHEYWSAQMRARVDAFVGDGGRVLVLGANTGYWQIRFEPDGLAIRCHKQPRRDPLAATDPGHATSTWLGEPVLDPQDRTFGMAWQHASWSAPLNPRLDELPWGLGVGPQGFPIAAGYGCWRLAAPAHPDLAALSLARGALFGAGTLASDAGPQPLGVCGGEVDGALTEELDGARPASSALGAPRNLLVLADAPAQEGFAAIAGFERDGEVLWCSSERVLRGLVEPRLAVPGLAEFVEAAVRRLSRPRRNLLAHAGFETWDGAAPRGWSVTGTVQRAERDETGAGSTAARLVAEGAVRQRLPSFSGADSHLLLVHSDSDLRSLRAVLLDGAGELFASAQPIGSDGRLLAAWVAPGKHAGVGSVVLQGSAPGNGLAHVDVDSVELLDARGVAADSLPLARAAPELTIVTVPTPGGGRLLAIAAAPGLSELHAIDAENGRRLAQASLRAGESHLLLAFDAGGRGRMVRIALQGLDAHGSSIVLDEAFILPLRRPSPAPPAALSNADFERTDRFVGPDGWAELGAHSALVVPEAALCGHSGLRLQSDDAGALLVQDSAGLGRAAPLMLTAWLRGTGSFLLSLTQGDLTLATSTMSAGPDWRAVRVEATPPPDRNDLRVELRLLPHAQVDIDAITLRSRIDALVDDLYPNGGFEIVPSEAEIARGADWTTHPPRWAALHGPPPRLDATRAFSGGHSLRVEAGASVVTRLGWPLAADSPALAGVHVLAAAPGAVTLRLLVGEAGAAQPPEVARWTNAQSNTWEAALLSVARGGPRGTPLDAYLVVEAGEGGAWLDELTWSGAE